VKHDNTAGRKVNFLSTSTDSTLSGSPSIFLPERHREIRLAALKIHSCGPKITNGLVVIVSLAFSADQG
jgi:hypothetical protein